MSLDTRVGPTSTTTWGRDLILCWSWFAGISMDKQGFVSLEEIMHLKQFKWATLVDIKYGMNV